MRAIWASNGPYSPSGYGVQTSLFVPRMQAAGHAMAVASNYGQQEGILPWQTSAGEILVYPQSADKFSLDILGHHALQHQADVVISHYDAWVYKPENLAGRWCPWFPMDCEHYPERVTIPVRQALLPITQTRYSVSEAAKVGLEVEYVPAAYDGSGYYPRSRIAWREKVGCQDSFVVGCVAANRGDVGGPSRKSYPQMFEAFSLFAKRQPNAKLYIHAHMDGHINLDALAQHYGIHEYLIRAHPYFLHTGLYRIDDMAEMYSGLDVLLSPSMGEGFGVPIVEAQACFPAGTDVIAEDARSGMRREYTGDLVRIETDKSVIEATPDHPFWTSEGWTRAGDLQPGCLLAYVGDAAQGRDDLHRGRIADVATALPHDDFAGDSGSHGQELRVPVLSGAEARSTQALFSDPDPQGSADLLAGFGVYGRDDRRRRHRVDQENAWLEMEAACADREYAFAGDRMVPSHDSWPFDIHRDGQGQGIAYAVLPVPDRGDRVGSVVRASSATSRHQARAHGTDLRMESASTRAVTHGATDREAVGDHRADPGFEYQAVRSVGRRAVRGIQVFNLKTGSGVYAAEGYLVHNCGTPVIVGDWTAMSEVARSGAKISKQDAFKYPIIGYGDQWLPQPGAICEALVESTKWPRADAQVSKLVAEYEVETVWRENWQPVLKKIEHKLATTPVEGEPQQSRQQRRAAARKQAKHKPERMPRATFNHVYTAAEDGEPAKRALLSFGTGPHEELLEIALPSYEQFARLHCYDLLVGKLKPPSKRPPSWWKIPMLLEALKTYDEVLFLGADLVIVDPEYDLYAPSWAWQALVPHKNQYGEIPNADVWLVRQPMQPILEQVWASDEYTEHGWWEQAALLHVMGYDFDPLPCKYARPTDLTDERTVMLDDEWNVHVYCEQPEHPRILHATMYPDRAKIMREWAEMAKCVA